MEELKNKSKRKATSSPYSLIDDSGETNQHLGDENVSRNVNVHKRRKKFEERYSRATLYIENDLLELLNEVSGVEKGEKTRIVNDALRKYLKV
ncbi:hypothetical protein GI364_24540 (plasmid) [Alicyclobacillus sp. SO9]|nr:hypothetical protein GI364_24540 [Alicyclobacillus sp. SO9]